MVDTKSPDVENWKRWSFYVDLIIYIIIALFFYLVIRDSYVAGTLQNSGGATLTDAWLAVLRDVAFITFGLAWTFFRLYKFRSLITRRYW